MGRPTTTATSESTPATASDAELATNRFNSIAVFVYQFETPKDAAVASHRLSEGLLGSLAALNQGDGQERLLSEDLSGIGDQATRSRLTITSTSDGWSSQTTVQYITVQRGEFVFVIAADNQIGPVDALPDTADQPDPVLDLATRIATEGQPSPGEPAYAADGTSTGGLWGFMPAAEDPLLMGLVPWTDQVLYPVPG